MTSGKMPVVDLFAGPGGLGEGFASHSGGTKFDLRLSMEVDPIACRTLMLRSFFRLSEGSARDDYYRFVRGEITEKVLVARNAKLWALANAHVYPVELGNPSRRTEVHQRIREVVGGEEFVLIGGPPCQAYSIVGRSRRLGVGQDAEGATATRRRRRLETEFYQDPRHHLYREYLEIIAVHRPVAFIMENVKGLSSAKTDAGDATRGMFEQIKADLRNPRQALRGKHKHIDVDSLRKTSYRLFALAHEQGNEKELSLFAAIESRASDFVVQCEHYGVPQARHRIIILGLREDVQVAPATLVPRGTISATEVLDSLPKIRSALSHDPRDWAMAIGSELGRIPDHVRSDLGLGQVVKAMRNVGTKRSTGGQWTPEALEPANRSPLFKWLLDPQLEGVLQHSARAHMASDLVRYLFCAAFARKHGRSPRLDEWPTSLRPRHRNVRSKNDRLTTSGFWDRFKVQGVWHTSSGGQPASTITSHIAKDGHYYIHFDPEQCRSLTVREAARLQTFPDNYFFCGNRTEQYRQVGNAVPPFLATQIAAIVSDVVSRHLEENVEAFPEVA